MSKTLNIVERAYQGTLEEQDDQVLWLVHALKKAGLEQQVLLRGAATSYAVIGQRAEGFSVAGVAAGNPPRLDQDVKTLHAHGVQVFLVREDAETRGIHPEDTLPEVQWVTRQQAVTLLQNASRILAW